MQCLFFPALSSRTFERRYGSRKFFSLLLTNFLLSMALESVISFAAFKFFAISSFSGLLSVGP